MLLPQLALAEKKPSKLVIAPGAVGNISSTVTLLSAGLPEPAGLVRVRLSVAKLLLAMFDVATSAGVNDLLTVGGTQPTVTSSALLLAIAPL